jgi:hypothetical protein
MWYTILRALSSTEAQHKGLVSVSWNHTPEGSESSSKSFSRPSPSCIYTLARTKEALPVRQICFHMCMNEGWSTTFIGWVRHYFMPRENRIRTRLHCAASQADVLESMGTKFGIPVDVFPLTPEGELKRDRHAGWIKTQELIETSYNNKNNKLHQHQQRFVSIPTQSDILLGRGKACQCHVGNLRFRLMLENKYDTYEKADKNEKMVQAREIVELVQSSGGRFLTLEAGILWTQVSDLVARKKVSHRFRAIRSARVENNNNNKTSHSAGCDGDSGGGKRARTAD